MLLVVIRGAEEAPCNECETVDKARQLVLENFPQAEFSPHWQAGTAIHHAGRPIFSPWMNAYLRFYASLEDILFDVGGKRSAGYILNKSIESPGHGVPLAYGDQIIG